MPFVRPICLSALLLPLAALAAPPPGWTERHGVYVLPANEGGQLALVVYIDRPTQRVTYGFRDLPQRMNCTPASYGRGPTLDIETKRIPFGKECVEGTFTYVPRNLPARKAFIAVLRQATVLHVRTASFFPLTFDLRGLGAVQRELQSMPRK